MRTQKETELQERVNELKDKVRILNNMRVGNREVIKKLETEIVEQQKSFDLYHAAEMRAIKYWQEQHPESEHVWPDKTKMSVWLMDRIEQLEALLDEYKDAEHRALKAHGEALQRIEQLELELRYKLDQSERIKNLEASLKLCNESSGEWTDEVERLWFKNKALREALREVAEYKPNYASAHFEVRKIALDALAKLEKDDED